MVIDGGPTQLPEPTIRTLFETRVRYEDDVVPNTVLIANNATPYTRTPAGPLGATYAATNGISFDWADEDIFFEYTINFDVGYLVGTPFEINHVKRTKIVPHNFESERGFVGLNDIVCYYPEEANPTKPGKEIFGPFCFGKYPHIFVKTTQTTPGTPMNLIATLDRVPVGIGNLVEEESFPSTAFVPMAQLDADELFDVDSTFSGAGEAWFKIDLSELGPGDWVICSIGLTI